MQDDPRKDNQVRRIAPEETKRITTETVTSGTGHTRRIPPPPAPRQPNPVPARPRRGIFPPIWAVLAMLVAVMACVGGLVALFIALGGRAAPGGESRLVILTADPALLVSSGNTSILMTATLAPGFAPQIQPPSTYIMLGPTLPPPAITRTPESVSVGKIVTVIDVGDQQLNVRDVPGVMGSSVIFRSPEGTRFMVTEGPHLVDGLTWWRIQDPSDNSRTGWAASNYLQVVPLTE